MKLSSISLILALLFQSCLGQDEDPFEPNQKPQGEEVTFFGGDGPIDLKSIQGKPIKRLAFMACDDLKDISAIAGMKLESVTLWKIDVKDITPLSGMPIEDLTIFGCPVDDLKSLKGMPLKSLWIGATNVVDFSPLKGLPLNHLSLYDSVVTDLSILEGMPLESLNLRVNGLSKLNDLTPLMGLNLKSLVFNAGEITMGLDVIRNMKSLEEINGIAADEFWKTYDAEQLELKKKTL
jgi:hypothetical protein